MFRELKDLIIEGLHLLLLYGFLCVCAIGVVTIFIANAPKNSPEVIYHVTHTSQIETAQRELESVEICNRIDGCPVVEGVCESCEIVILNKNNLFYSTFIMCMDCSAIWISNL